MTEQLRTLMDRAAEQDFAAVDLDAITGAGDRTVRRRRVASGVAGIATLAVVATGAVLLAGDDGRDETDFVDRDLPTDVPLWTEGSTLHTPTEEWDLGVDVVSMARTSEGIVFAGPADEGFGIYTFGGAEPERIGESSTPVVVGDVGSPYVSWVAADDEVVVLDLRSGERVWTTPDQEDGISYPLLDIDGSRAYVVDLSAGESRVVDLETGVESPAPGGGPHRFVIAAEGDLRAVFVESDGGADQGIEVQRQGATEPVVVADSGSGAVFSPDGRWVSILDGELTVHDTETGEARDIDAGFGREAIGYDWLDDDTLLAIGEGEGDGVDLMSCEVPDGTCTVHARLPGFESQSLYAVTGSYAFWGSAVLEGDADVTETVTAEATMIAPPETAGTDGPG